MEQRSNVLKWFIGHQKNNSFNSVTNIIIQLWKSTREGSKYVFKKIKTQILLYLFTCCKIRFIIYVFIKYMRGLMNPEIIHSFIHSQLSPPSGTKRTLQCLQNHNYSLVSATMLNCAGCFMSLCLCYISHDSNSLD